MSNPTNENVNNKVHNSVYDNHREGAREGDEVTPQCTGVEGSERKDTDSRKRLVTSDETDFTSRLYSIPP